MNIINWSNIFSYKTIVYCILILAVIYVPADFLFSASAQPRSLQKAEDKQDAQKQTDKNKPVNAPKKVSKEEEAINKFVDEKLGDGGYKRPSLITQAVAISTLSLLPFIIMILTSFMKIVIVLSLLRNALGVQQAPPNQILNGVALMLTMFIMYPTATLMYQTALEESSKLETPESFIDKGSSTYILAMVNVTKVPLKNFLITNSNAEHRTLFYRIAYKVLPENTRDTLKDDDLIIVIPAYVTSQLKSAFEIGVLIYIPFFVIDLVTSNVLLAMGMMMLSPVTISMPLKLFLLVMLDGWTLLIEGLVNTFR